jgi:hypothetical protein
MHWQHSSPAWVQMLLLLRPRRTLLPTSLLGLLPAPLVASLHSLNLIQIQKTYCPQHPMDRFWFQNLHSLCEFCDMHFDVYMADGIFVVEMYGRADINLS